MTSANQPLMDLIRSTPPPSINLPESIRSIPPPPLCPPPFTILKMVPPPPLPSHVTRAKCPPAPPTGAPTGNVSQTTPPTSTPTSSCGMPSQPGSGSGRAKPAESAFPEFGKASGNESKSKYTLATSSTMSSPSGPPAGGGGGGSGAISEGFDAASERGASPGTSAIEGLPLDNGDDGSEAERSTSTDAAELVVVLRHLVNLFTMTSHVKTTLGRIRTKPDDAGMIHQVGRTRALLDTFREQLARRTVMLGRLIPPDTSGKPEIPREIRTKDPAGGDVSPQLESAASPPEPGTRAAMLSIQALVSADADQSQTSRASRWGSRVKRRFLASTKPTRRHGDRLKGPATAGGAWPSVEESFAGAPVRADSSSEEDTSQRAAGAGGYISPGCYVIDGASGLPSAVDGAAGPAESAPNSRQSARNIFTGCMPALPADARKTLGSTSTSQSRGALAAASSVALDTSWQTACDLVPKLIKKAEHSPLLHTAADVDATTSILSDLSLAGASGQPANQRPATGHMTDVASLQHTPNATAPAAGAASAPVEERADGTPRSGKFSEHSDPEDSWHASFNGFEEDWYVAAEREERERAERGREG